MSYRDFFDALNSSPPRRIYVIWGEEEFLCRKAYQALAQRVLQNALPEFNHTVFAERKLDIRAFSDALEALPVMADTRLVEVRDCPLFVTAKARARDEEEEAGGAAEQKALLAALENVPQSAVALFRYGGSVSFKARPRDALKKAGAVFFEFATLAEGEALPILRRFARDGGTSFAKGCDSFLYQYAGNSLTALENEVAKLAAAAGGQPITHALIEELSVQSVEWKVFALLDLVFTGKRKPAMEMLLGMLNGGEYPGAILSLVGRQLRFMWLAHGLASGRIKGLAQAMGERAYPLEIAARQGKNIQKDALGQALQACADTDRSIKQGLMAEQTAVEVLVAQVMEMCGGGKTVAAKGAF